MWGFLMLDPLPLFLNFLFILRIFLQNLDKNFPLTHRIDTFDTKSFILEYEDEKVLTLKIDESPTPNSTEINDFSGEGEH